MAGALPCKRHLLPHSRYSRWVWFKKLHNIHLSQCWSCVYVQLFIISIVLIKTIVFILLVHFTTLKRRPTKISSLFQFIIIFNKIYVSFNSIFLLFNDKYFFIGHYTHKKIADRKQNSFCYRHICSNRIDGYLHVSVTISIVYKYIQFGNRACIWFMIV